MEDVAKEKQNVISVRCNHDFYMQVKHLQIKGNYRSVPEMVCALIRAELKRTTEQQPAPAVVA